MASESVLYSIYGIKICILEHIWHQNLLYIPHMASESASYNTYGIRICFIYQILHQNLPGAASAWPEADSEWPGADSEWPGADSEWPGTDSEWQNRLHTAKGRKMKEFGYLREGRTRWVGVRMGLGPAEGALPP